MMLRAAPPALGRPPALQHNISSASAQRGASFSTAELPLQSLTTRGSPGSAPSSIGYRDSAAGHSSFLQCAGDIAAGRGNSLQDWSDLRGELCEGFREELQTGVLQLRRDLADAVSHVVAEIKGSLGVESSRIQETVQSMCSHRDALQEVHAAESSHIQETVHNECNHTDALQEASAGSSKSLMETVESCRAIGCQILEAIDSMSSNISNEVGKATHRSLSERTTGMHQVDERLETLHHEIAESGRCTTEAINSSKMGLSVVTEGLIDTHSSLMAAMNTNHRGLEAAMKTSRTEFNMHMREILDVVRDFNAEPDLSSLHASLDTRHNRLIEVIHAGRLDHSEILQMQSSIEQNHCEMLTTLREGIADMGVRLEVTKSIDKRLMRLEAIHSNHDKIAWLHGETFDGNGLHGLVEQIHKDVLSATERLDNGQILYVLSGLEEKLAPLSKRFDHFCGAVEQASLEQAVDHFCRALDDSAAAGLLSKLASLQEDLGKRCDDLDGKLESHRQATLQDAEQRHEALVDMLENCKVDSVREDMDTRFSDLVKKLECYEPASLQENLEIIRRHPVSAPEHSEVGHSASQLSAARFDELIASLQLTLEGHHRNITSTVHGWKVDHSILLEEVRAIQALLSPLHGDINRLKNSLSGIESQDDPAPALISACEATIVQSLAAVESNCQKMALAIDDSKLEKSKLVQSFAERCQESLDAIKDVQASHSSFGEDLLRNFNSTHAMRSQIDASHEKLDALLQSTKADQPDLRDAIHSLQSQIPALWDELKRVNDSQAEIKQANGKQALVVEALGRSELKVIQAINNLKPFDDMRLRTGIENCQETLVAIADEKRNLSSMMEAFHSFDAKLSLLRDVDAKQTQLCQVLSNIEPLLSSRLEELLNKSQGYLASVVKESEARFSPLHAAIDKCRGDLIFAIDRVALSQCRASDASEDVAAQAKTLQEAVRCIAGMQAGRTSSEVEFSAVLQAIAADNQDLKEGLRVICRNLTSFTQSAESEAAADQATVSDAVSVDKTLYNMVHQISGGVMLLTANSRPEVFAGMSEALQALCADSKGSSSLLERISTDHKSFLSKLQDLSGAVAHLGTQSPPVLESINSVSAQLQDLNGAVANLGAQSPPALAAITSVSAQLQDLSAAVARLGTQPPPAFEAIPSVSAQLQDLSAAVAHLGTQWSPVLEAIASVSARLSSQQEAVSNRQRVELSGILDDHQQVAVEHLENQTRSLTTVLGSIKEDVLEAVAEACSGGKERDHTSVLPEGAQQSPPEVVTRPEVNALQAHVDEILSMLNEFKFEHARNTTDLANMMSTVQSLLQTVEEKCSLLQSMNGDSKAALASDVPQVVFNIDD